jgi:hypothetical protein
MIVDTWKTPRASSSAQTGSGQTVAPVDFTQISTNALDVDSAIMALRAAISARKMQGCTPLRSDAWKKALLEANLNHKYPNIDTYILSGFGAGIPPVKYSYTPLNRIVTPEHIAAFQEVVKKELARGRWIGPYSLETIEAVLGPVQTSPITMVPKPGKPGKYRLVQNLSHPHNPLIISPNVTISSINSAIDSTLYPCLWGTFANTCRLLHTLPPGSQGAIRDISEAYRTIPLHHSQWPGTVVRVSDDTYCIDTCTMFGLASAAGTYGKVADAGLEIFRFRGIGPVSKWVDDHLFLRIKRNYLRQYNKLRAQLRERVLSNGGIHHVRGRLIYYGESLPNGRPEEFDDDFNFPLKDLSGTNPCNDDDMAFTYNMDNIDTIATELGYKFESEKDIQFCYQPLYFGFEWNITNLQVFVPDSKRQKYHDTIIEWERRSRHNLEQANQLYGKLMHVTHVLARGRAYLTHLETLIANLSNASPFTSRYPPKLLAEDLNWWKEKLAKPIYCKIPGPAELIDLDAYSDASGGHGIGICIRGYWRAYRLLPGWRGDSERDIGWAEAVGFEMLVRIVTIHSQRGHHYKVRDPKTAYKHPLTPLQMQVYGDNEGVVEGWWNGRSRNRATNLVFRRIHDIIAEHDISVHTRYIPSKHNPADDPSRGKYGPPNRLLPKIDIPDILKQFIIDSEEPLTRAEERSRSASRSLIHDPKPRRNYNNANAFARAQEHEAEELLRFANAW